MPRLLKVFSLNNHIHTVLKHVFLFVFLSVFGEHVLGQNCNNLSVSVGSDIEACNGANIILTATYTGGPSSGMPSYQWSVNRDGGVGGWVDVLGATSNTYTISNFSNISDGIYTCTVTFSNANNCDESDNLEVIFPNNNNFSLDAGNDITICQGQIANINSSVSDVPNGGTVTYSWTSNTGAYTSSIADPSFSNLPVGVYTFIGTATSNGCTDTDQISVTVNPSPTAPPFSIPASGCPGVSIPISSFSPLPGITYTWFPNTNTTFSNTNTSNPSVTFNVGDNFGVSYTATNSIGCSTNSSIQNISITSLAVNNPFIQSSSNNLTPSIYNGIPTYTLCGGSSGGSSASVFYTLPNNGAVYTFASASVLPTIITSSAIANNIILDIGNNFFTITGVLNGCTVTRQFNIYAGSNPYVAGGVSNSVGLCTGQTVNFSISTINPATNTPNAAGTTYTIGVSDVPSSLPNNPNYSPYATFQDINGNQNVQYTFNSSSCGQSTVGFPANAFYATITASNACGSTSSSVSPIVVSKAPTANFNVSASTICVNSSITITNVGIAGNAIAGVNNSAPFSCTTTGAFFYTISPATGWTSTTLGADGIPAGNWGGITAAANSANVNFNTPGTYTITQKYQNGCGISTFERTICVVPPPTCSFSVDPTDSCTPLITNITNNTTGPSCGTTPLALAYNWTVTNPVGGTSSIATATAVNPTITLNNNTAASNLAILNFPINLVVNPLTPGTSTPVPNCSSTCNQTVTVYPQPSFIAQPIQPTAICFGGTFNSISVTVSYLGPGVPSYQWYSNVNPVSSGGTLIPGATASSYVPPATVVGTIHYYCVVTFPLSTLCNTIISNNVPAIVVPDPIASATPLTQTICVGGTVPDALTGAYINGVGTPSYQWNLVGTPTTSITGATSSTYTPTAFSSTGTFNYTVTINTSGSGCSASTSTQIAVVVIPDPTTTAPVATQTLCQNAAPTALTVSASGGSGTLQYQWFSNTTNSTSNGVLIPGATNSTYTPPTSVVGTFYYYCEVTTPVSGCSVTSATSTVIVNLAPTFTTQPTASNVCVGGTPTQMCVTYINGTGTPSYQWYSNSANTTLGATAITGATNSCYTPPASAAGTTYYFAIISLTGGGCSIITSNIAAVVVTPDPALTTQPSSTQTICVGGNSGPLSVSIQAATGIGAFTYQWFSNTAASNTGGTSIANANAATFNPPVFNTAGTFYYYCIVTDAGNGCGTVTSQLATIIVVVDPTITVQPISTQTLCQNAAPTALTVSASGGSGTLQYQWFSNTINSASNGTLIQGATNSTYTPPTSVVGTFYYYCEVTTPVSGCSVTSAIGTVVVNPAPTFTTQPTASNVCVGGTTNQMCVDYSNGTGTAAYQWYSNANNNTTTGSSVSGATSSCYTPPSTTAGTTYYYAIISLTGGGCSSITSNTASVVITPDPIITAQPIATQTICEGGISAPLSVSIQAATGIGAFTYQWFSNTTASNSGGTSIANANAATFNPPVFNTAGTFYYYCLVTDAGNGCGTVTSQVATIIVVVDPTITAQPLPTQTLCLSAAPTALTVTASGGTGTLEYQWYSNTVNNSTSGTAILGATTNTYSPLTATLGTIYYYCIVTTPASGCSVTSAIGTVLVNPAPTFTTQPASSNVCVGGTTNQMCVTYTNGTGTPSYQWYSSTTNATTGGTSITGATSSCLIPPSTTSGTTYYYAIISLTGGGCSGITSNTAEVIVNANTSLSAQPTPSQTICVGGSVPVPLSVVFAGGAGTPSYQWFESPSNTPIVGANSSSFTPSVFSAIGNTSYYVTVTLAGAGCGIQTSNIAEIIVVADPTATITSGASYCQNAASVNALSVSAQDGQGTFSYQWYSNTTGGNTSGNPISGANTSTYTPPVSQTGSSYYYCAVTQSGANCAVNSPASLITVTPAPTFTTQPTPTQSVCVGGTTTQLNVDYSNGTGTATYQWYSNTTNGYTGGNPIAGQTNSSFTPPSASSSTIYYYCIISFSAAGGCSMINSNIAEVVVLPDPTISTQPLTTQTICVGGTTATALNVSYIGGVGTPTYQWFSTPASSISGATSNSYTPPVYSAAGTFNYYATISLSGSGCDALTSANAAVIVVADPLATISTGASYCQNAGSVVSLSVAVSNGEGTSSYQWYSNTTGGNTSGTPIAGANASTYTPPVNQTGVTYYYCVVTQSGANCAVNSPASLITVTPAPTFTTQPAPTQSVCVGGTTTQLNVAYNNGTGTATYQWYSNTTNVYAGGTPIAGQTASSFTPPSASSGTLYYYCIVSFSADGGCSMINSNIAEVVVLPDPTISTQPLTTQTICVGGTIPTALNVAYTGGVGTPTYQWFSTPAITIGGETNSSFTPSVFNTPGTYNYYVTIGLSGSGCDALTSNNASVIVLADPLVSAQPTTTQSVCQYTATSQLSVSITGGTGTASYQWYSNTTNSNVGGTPIAGATLNTYTPPSAVVGTQFYYCTITQTGTNCGVTSNPAAVVVNLAPIFSNQPINTQQHCLNQSTNPLQVAYSNGTGTPTYQWYVSNNNTISGGTPINLATSNTYSPPSNIDGTFYYYCVVSFVSGGGCPSITSNISEVIIHPFPIVTITGGDTICLLESSDINFAFTPSGGLYDITYIANGQSVTIDNYNGANPFYTVTPTQSTTYVVTNIAYDLVPQCAIQPNTSIVVNVNPLPALDNSDFTFCSDVASATIDYISDANSYTYNWLPNPAANFTGQVSGPSSISVTLPDPIGNAPTNYYYVTSLVNNTTGCLALDSILVTINPNPVGNFTLPSTGCLNSPVPLSNGDATIGSYEWSIDGVLYSILANPEPPVFTSLGNYTIEMVAINSFGCTDTLNSVIQIYDLPVANFTIDTNGGCAPIEVNFTNLSSGLFITSYDWTFAPDTVSWNYQYTSSNLIDPPSVTYQQGDATAIYTAFLAVTNACGTVTAQEDITVLPTPVAGFTFATPTICSGSSLIINNTSVGEPLTYSWTYGNTISSNPNLLSMFFPSDSVTNVYPLTLTLTNACGTDTYIDSVTVLPDLVNGGFVTSIDAGCSPLSVTLTNTTLNSSLSSTWYLDDPQGTIVSNQSSVQFTYFATNNTTQTYNPYLIVTDGCASDTIVANLSVFANPIPMISVSQTNLCAGTTVDFSGTIAGGDTGFGYSWNFGGLGTSNSSSASFNFPDGDAQGLSIPITLTTTSPTFFGTNCSNTTTTLINVYPNPDVSLIAFNTTSGCSDLDIVLSNLPPATNQINWGDGTTNFGTEHTYTNNGPGLLSYPVEITSTNTYGTMPLLNCIASVYEVISVYPTPLPQIFSSSINVCEGDNVDFIANTSNNQNTGVSYLWDFGVLGTSNNSNASIEFSSGSSLGLPNQVLLTAFQNTSGTICSATVSEDVLVFDTPDLSTALFNEVNGCSPLLVSISNLPTSTYTYNWGDGITTTNPNHLYINQGTGPLNYNIVINATTFYPTLPQLVCSAIANQIVQANPQPFAAFAMSPEEGCLYTPVNTTLQNTSLNAIAPYVWNYNGNSYTTNSLNYIATFNTAGPQPIELIVTNQFGCTDSVSDNFMIYDLPTVTLNAVDNESCAGEITEFEIDGTGISTSTWDFGDGTSLNLLNPSSVSHYYNQPGVYSITATVTNIYGCTDTTTFINELIVHPTPIASFTTNYTTADIVYPYFEFYDLSSGATNYYWDFGDSFFSNDSDATHTYQNIGNYLVELTVSNEYNCFDSANLIVIVEGIVVHIPNTFTPLDYNGVNDVFKPTFSSTEGIEFYEMIIYNRWGTKIFQTNSIDEAWIGNSRENETGSDNYYAQNDSYIYTVRFRKKARANDPQPDQIITGHVTIIR